MAHRGLEARHGEWSDGIRSSTLFTLPESRARHPGTVTYLLVTLCSCVVAVPVPFPGLPLCPSFNKARARPPVAASAAPLLAGAVRPRPITEGVPGSVLACCAERDGGGAARERPGAPGPCGVLGPAWRGRPWEPGDRWPWPVAAGAGSAGAGRKGTGGAGSGPSAGWGREGMG